MPVVCKQMHKHLATVMIHNLPRQSALEEDELRQLALIWPRLSIDLPFRYSIVEDAGELFCSGAYLAISPTAIAETDELIDAWLLKIRSFPTPLLAAISGHCVAGALAFARSVRHPDRGGLRQAPSA